MARSHQKQMYDLPDAIKREYIALRWFDDKGWCGLHRLLYHYTIHEGIDDIGYHDRWCLDQSLTLPQAVQSFALWDGKDDPGPLGWHKRVSLGLYRDIKTGIIWHESQPKPKDVT